MGGYGNGDISTGGLIALLLVVLPLLLLFALAGYIITSVFFMKIFEKAGVQGKWRAWVPVYNYLVFAKLGDLSPWVMLGAIVAGSVLSNVPAIGFIFGLLPFAAFVLASYRVGLKLGKDWPLLLLNLIPGLGSLIWLGIAAFTSSPWNPRVQPSPWRTTFLRDTTVWQGIPAQPDAGAAGAGHAGYGTPQGGNPTGAPHGAAPTAPGAYPPPAQQHPTTPPPAGAYPPPASPQQPPAPPTEPPTTQPPAPDAPRP